MILCADIGGTKTLLGLAERDAAGALNIVHRQRFEATQAASFDAIVDTFLAQAQSFLRRPLRGALFGVAGPVQGAVVQMTNLPWALDSEALSRRLGVPVGLANDFRVAARGIDLLQPQDLLRLQAGEPLDEAPQLVIGAGTGLGVALRIWDGKRYLIVPGEGGHVGFSPLDAEQNLAMERLRLRTGKRIVAEHFVSGSGLLNFYQLTDGSGPAGPPPLLQQAREVMQQAQQAHEPHALKALDHFLRAYGAVAGDHALAHLTRGGVFIAGGVALHCAQEMADGRFIQAFKAKHPYAELMRTMPVHLVLQPELGLLGAALLGEELLQPPA